LVCFVVAGSPGFCGRDRLADAVLDEPIRRAVIDIDDSASTVLDTGMGVDLVKFDLRHVVILSG